MAMSSLFSPNFVPVTSSIPASRTLCPSHSCVPFNSSQHICKKREFPLTSAASIPYQPVNVDYLEEEFSGHGVTFERLDDSCIAKLKVENGSTATLMLPSGLITSYKPLMWHGTTQEVLQTLVSEGEDESPVIQGGVSLAVNFESDGESPWSPTTWALHDIRGNSQDSIQVELISTDAMNKVEVRYIMSLKEDGLSSELVVTNAKSSPIKLMGSVLSHLTVSTPEATYACGLERSDYCSRPMLLSSFSIVPPDPGQENEFGLAKMLNVEGLSGFWSGWGNGSAGKMSEVESEAVMEGEEDDNYKQLTEKMSRIYTYAPQDFTIIDRGRRNSVVVARNGFDEMYLHSPGSSHESYGMYSYVSVGQSAMLKPIILSPGEVWTGGQCLHNPNL